MVDTATIMGTLVLSRPKDFYYDDNFLPRQLELKKLHSTWIGQMRLHSPWTGVMAGARSLLSACQRTRVANAQSFLILILPHQNASLI
jgi:hypothetical protein